ncbi:UNVERIFIED_CONTAM: hypothetical protein HDU68_011114, partial [Siphonaria sp. JEL0065]
EYFIDQDRLSNLFKVSNDLVSKLDASLPSKRKEIYDGIDYAGSNFADFKDKATAVLNNASVLNGAVGITSKETLGVIDQMANVIGNIADTHPILKIAWFVISVGYQMAKAANDRNLELLNLFERFTKASLEIERLKSLHTDGIPESTCLLLSECIGDYIGCLTDVVTLYIDVLNENARKRLVSGLFGTAAKQLKDINARLDKSQQDLTKVKTDGTLEIIVSVARDVVYAQHIATENLTATRHVQETMDEIYLVVQDSTKTAEERQLNILREYCRFTEIHSAGEIISLSQKRNQNTRGWIIGKICSFILENYQEKKIYWLRGEAGTGKSVIAGSVASELEKKRILSAAFFCQHDNKLRDSTAALIQTLSYEVRCILLLIRCFDIAWFSSPRRTRPFKNVLSSL